MLVVLLVDLVLPSNWPIYQYHWLLTININISAVVTIQVPPAASSYECSVRVSGRVMIGDSCTSLCRSLLVAPGFNYYYLLGRVPIDHSLTFPLGFHTISENSVYKTVENFDRSIGYRLIVTFNFHLSVLHLPAPRSFTSQVPLLPRHFTTASPPLQQPNCIS